MANKVPRFATTNSGDAGDVVRDYTYDVYGEVTGGSGSTPNEFDFAGQQSDDPTGLQYLRARYYDPATGVFISRDPLAAGPGWLGNPHGYASANPANLVDPTGLFGCGFCKKAVKAVGDAASAAAGAAKDAAGAT